MVSREQRLDAITKISNLRPLSSYTEGEKCKAFDKLWQFALHLLNAKAKKGTAPSGSYYWCFEMVLDLLGIDIWTIYNKLDK